MNTDLTVENYILYNFTAGDQGAQERSRNLFRKTTSLGEATERSVTGCLPEPTLRSLRLSALHT